MKTHLDIRPHTDHSDRAPCLSLWQKASGVVRAWCEQARQRQTLAMLSDDALKDLGLSRADAEQESRKSFWEGPFSH
ncbi:hypothetical protein GCM10009425_11960 [Pseudomonas asuensis]|uniref:YjiS-like domain-containing protein n=1 Tax=Pseudomonas asuensis TaxID=1825787 RepID=A0ABQ2GME3_9PSED|nr:DUF1127 domain-containing protein [Pseudomonas asuensis]GGM02279.1 hypothetical protein GCM10009425_11960 [Pseudomonas asuensis]